jgi:biopolymer transport protein ExbB
LEADGEKREQMVTRVGAFNLVSDGIYLNYQPSTGQIVELGRQPSSRFTGMIDDVEVEPKLVTKAFAIDPSRGSLLSMLGSCPKLL